MKKIFLSFALLIALSSHAQDTTYIQKRNMLYRQISTLSLVNDSVTLKQYKMFDYKRHKKSNRRFLIIAGSIWGSITAWYFLH